MRVRLERPLDQGQLEEACRKAVSELNWKMNVRDREKTEYALDGSVDTRRVYLDTEIRISGSFLPLLMIDYDKTETIRNFGLYNSVLFGVATKRETRKFLETLNNYIKKAKPLCTN